MLDYGRQTDLIQLMEGIKNARSVSEREGYEKIAYKLVNQSTTITSLRDELIKAIRAKDRAAVKRIQLHIQAVRLEETRGSSWGDLKQEQKI